MCRLDGRTHYLQHIQQNRTQLLFGTHHRRAQVPHHPAGREIRQEDQAHTGLVSPSETLISALGVRHYPFHLAEMSYIL